MATLALMKQMTFLVELFAYSVCFGTVMFAVIAFKEEKEKRKQQTAKIK